MIRHVAQQIGSNYEEKPFGSIFRVAQWKLYYSEDGVKRFLWNTSTKLQEFTCQKIRILTALKVICSFLLSKNNLSVYHSRKDTGSNAQSPEWSTTYWCLSNTLTTYIRAKCPHIQLSVLNGTTTQEKITHTENVLGETMPRNARSEVLPTVY